MKTSKLTSVQKFSLENIKKDIHPAIYNYLAENPDLWLSVNLKVDDKTHELAILPSGADDKRLKIFLQQSENW